MTHIIRPLATITLVVFVFLSVGHTQSAVKKDLPNFYKVNEKLYRGGQPTEAGIDELKGMGIKTIINLRDNDDNERKEEALAKAAGIRFVNVPLSNWFSPHNEDIKAVLAEIDRTDGQPVFIHCKRGADRTGTAIAVYRITHDGWTDKQANAEAKQFGFGWWQVWMKHYINDYYDDHIKTH